MDMISENENEHEVSNPPAVSKKQPKQHFKVCFCFKRIFKHRLYEPPEDIKKLFEQYSENGTMTVEDMQRFLIEVQKESNASKDSAQAIFNSLKHLNMFHRKGLNFEAFYRYLLGDSNLAIPRVVHQDMKAPLAHYFIFTGHNSYLTGNQLSSDSSEVPIIDALKRGVKVIELDLWPEAGRGDGVEVRHGGTLTRPVELIKCLKAIRDHAFSVSDYPVVITFEDHLTPYYQSKVAQMVTKTFGELLYRSESELKEFPSPESLKKKILISTKPPKEFHDQASSSSKDETCNLNVEQMLVAWHDWDDQTGEENAVPQYKNLIAIRAAKPKGVKDIWAIDPDKVRRLSLSEQELENAVNTRGTDIVRFTQKNLLRVYPKGLRLDSSNYNPMLGWMHGAQMVALNMQGYGKYLWIMQGMFRANGGCGYVKKPNFLLEVTPSNEVFDPSDMPRTQKTLKVKVYLGEGWHSDFRHTHFDRFSPPDFFVRVGIAGVPADEVIKQTKAIEDEWLPMWNEEFEFPLKAPELAVLRIEVLEYDTSGKNDFGGQACLPVSELRTGIRVIPLHNKKGDKYNSVKLLMRFEFL
ncbi:hypothetical protein F2P56_032323 [Juglans regia]|uniref:Phosphoinositide phospholipase C n=2 Tax=Juglans regia TaxID=51240 RepID=A0A2I4FUS0_JUGRE|nr:phosphoinositide phospholipase C 2-like [Juglans regia]KAF5446720.1 hypothetical protein F2P56_032323 [Juglans regia]